MRISTLTLNPTIDLACEAEKVRPVRKVRTFDERQDPGGGGVNVARVVRELGGETLAMVLVGGVTGHFLEELLEEIGVPHRSIPIAGRTRISQTVLDRSLGEEFRFVPEGPEVAEAEWQAALAALEELPEGEWLVASGSLPRGVPEDFYARAGAIARRRGLRMVLDTSGAALRAGVGPEIELIKPSLGEFESLVGRELRGEGDLEAAAREMLGRGIARRIAVTLGKDGALLAWEGGLRRLDALPVTVRGAVGAGDSFVAAMTLALARGAGDEDAFAWGVAAGAAAVSNAGTAHPTEADVRRLRAMVPGLPLPG
ncbi:MULTISPECIES: 1-phosphofructokinase family hexose kinase [Acetobacterales]|uniref:1-phosphofructokinase family hexose kinase n=1 Tax=Roseomonas sp. WGS1072 TaxID=3366816 RepID=UPI003BEFA2BE